MTLYVHTPTIVYDREHSFQVVRLASLSTATHCTCRLAQPVRGRAVADDLRGLALAGFTAVVVAQAICICGLGFHLRSAAVLSL